MRSYDVIVVGGGASGLVAAIAAAGSGASVCVLEKGRKLASKVLASGNGRCNFCNDHLDPSVYNDPAFVGHRLDQDALGRILGFWHDLGLWYVTEDEGRMYPRSRSSQSVVDVLTHALDVRGVTVMLEAPVVGVAPVTRSALVNFKVNLADGSQLGAKVLIWAAGGDSAHIPARDLGLPVVPTRPVLVPLATAPKPPRAWDGVRARGELRLERAGEVLAREGGELLWRKYGVSGIAVFNLSRHARKGDALVFDLMPDIPAPELAAMLSERVAVTGQGSRGLSKCGQGGPLREGAVRVDDPRSFLDGIVHPVLAATLMGECSGAGTVDITALAKRLKNLTYTVDGPAMPDQAQVSAGGLALGAFDPVGFSARSYLAFKATGEALDVDGPCGGFNLGWAWASGLAAGTSAAAMVGK